MAQGSRQSCASRSSAVLGNASSRSHHSWQQTPNGSGHHMLVWSASKCGSKYRTMLRCPAGRTHPSSPPTDGSSRLPWSNHWLCHKPSRIKQWSWEGNWDTWCYDIQKHHACMLCLLDLCGLRLLTFGRLVKSTSATQRSYTIIHWVTAPPKQNQRCVVWFHHCVRHLWWRNHGECFHDTVWVLFSHLGNQECSHACTSASTKGMAKLKSLKAITTFGLLANDIKHGVNQLSSLSVVTFSPVVSCSSLAEDKVVWTEQLAKRSGTNTVHGSCNQDVVPKGSKGMLHWKRLSKDTL